MISNVSLISSSRFAAAWRSAEISAARKRAASSGLSASVLPLVIMHTRMKFGSASRPVASSFTVVGAIGRYSVDTIAASTTPTVSAL